MWQLLLDMMGRNALMQISVTLWTALSLAGLGTVMLFRKGPDQSRETMAGILVLSSLPASHCPGCGTALGFIDRTPLIGWLAAGGRCRHCAMKIPLRYPAIEMAFLAPAMAAAIPALGTPWALAPAGLSLLYPIVYMAMRGLASAKLLCATIALSVFAAALLPGAPPSLAIMILPFAAGTALRKLPV